MHLEGREETKTFFCLFVYWKKGEKRRRILIQEVSDVRYVYKRRTAAEIFQLLASWSKAAAAQEVPAAYSSSLFFFFIFSIREKRQGNSVQ